MASQDPSTTDEDILRRIESLVAEEHRLYHDRELTLADRDRLDQLSVELDRLWDTLRRLRAMRRAGLSPEPPHHPNRGRKRTKGDE